MNALICRTSASKRVVFPNLWLLAPRFTHVSTHTPLNNMPLSFACSHVPDTSSKALGDAPLQLFRDPTRDTLAGRVRNCRCHHFPHNARACWGSWYFFFGIPLLVPTVRVFSEVNSCRHLPNFQPARGEGKGKKPVKSRRMHLILYVLSFGPLPAVAMGRIAAPCPSISRQGLVVPSW